VKPNIRIAPGQPTTVDIQAFIRHVGSKHKYVTFVDAAAPNSIEAVPFHHRRAAGYAAMERDVGTLRPQETGISTLVADHAELSVETVLCPPHGHSYQSTNFLSHSAEIE
jgi:hypothetical protein